MKDHTVSATKSMLIDADKLTSIVNSLQLKISVVKGWLDESLPSDPAWSFWHGKLEAYKRALDIVLSIE